MIPFGFYFTLPGHLIRFSTQVIRWIEELLRDRVSVAEVNGLMSNEFYFLWSVLQGSVISPLLFLLYINGMQDCSSTSDCRLYADDTLSCCDVEK